MRPDPKRLATRYMTKQAAEASDLTAGRLVDLANFVIALDAYRSHLTAKGQDTSELLTRGVNIARRVQDEAASTINQFLVPMLDRPDAGPVKSAIRMALKSGSVLDMNGYRANAFRSVFPWLRTKPGIFNDLFQGRDAKAAREVAAMAENESFAGQINQAAVIVPVSRLMIPRKWIEQAAADVGAPISTTETTLVAAAEAKSIGEQLAVVNGRLGAARPNTPDYASLQAEKADLQIKLENVAKLSGDRPVVMATAASVQPTRQYVSQVAEALHHTPEQEDAMLSRGLVMIAAGAGSGKTRVLASKVVHHIKELGVAPSSIMATTFTTKAAAELIKRCKDYGAPLENNTEGFGTTHSVAFGILRRSPSFMHKKTIGKKEGFKQNIILRLAIEQVQMKPAGGALIPPPPPKGFWDDAMASARRVQQQTPQAPKPGGPGMAPAAVEAPAPPEPVEDHAYTTEIEQALRYYNWAVSKWSGPRLDWARRTVQFLNDLLDKGTPKIRLTPKQKEYLNDIFARMTRGGAPVTTYRVAAEAEGKPQKERIPSMEEFQYFKSSANQWFNIGADLTEDVEGGKGKDKGKGKKALAIGKFKNFISIHKGKGLTPSEVFAQTQSTEAAVYGAYEWLKGPAGEPFWQNTGDMDDGLIDCVRALIADPRLRRSTQAQYKVILVDEAQDLNRVQHLLFGLVAGHVNPGNLESDCSQITADTFAYIGDDKQAIYEFRGADPEEFIRRSDLGPDRGCFKTKLLDTNFRSGSVIVESANNLISHNERQVPMVCKAFPASGEGALVQKEAESTEDSAVLVAEEIEEMMQAGNPGSSEYKSFGVALRSNAEAYAYGVEMLKRGIPFRSNRSFFNDPNTKALIGWLTLAEKGLDGPPDMVNDALIDATKIPVSKLGTRFVEALEEKAVGSWPAWLVKNPDKVYKGSGYADTVKAFASNVEKAAKLTGSPDEIINKILNFKGIDGKSVLDAMIETVRENADLMRDLAAESADGEASEAQVRDMAQAPISPLLGLLKSKKTLTTSMEFVRKLRNVNQKISSADTEKEIDRDAVTIGTMHSWKGLEVPTMYVPLVGGRFPRCGPDGLAKEGPDLWSERRLAYVAITRAQQRCVMLNIPNEKTGVTSQFLDEVCAPSEKKPGTSPLKLGSDAWVERQMRVARMLF